MSDLMVTVKGMDEVIDGMKALAQKYPDRVGDFVRKEAFKTRGMIVKEVRDCLDVDHGNDASLGKIKNYAVSQVKGYGSGQYVEISAKSPHFHLLENGHNLLDRRTKQPVGQGWVPGYQMAGAAYKKEQERYPQNASEFIDDLLQKEGLT